MLRIIFFILLFFHANNIYAQSPFQLSSSLDLPILSTEAGLLGITIQLHKRFPALTPKDTINLDFYNIPRIDRHVVYNWSPKAQRSSDILLRSSPLIPLALPLLAGRSSRHSMGVTYTVILEGMLACYTLTEVSKLLVKRKRPYVYGRSTFDGPLFDANAQKSFFSGHSSYTALNYFMGAKMFNEFYPDSNWGNIAWATAAIIPAITAWKRVKGGKHFVTDVLTGYVVGALVGILIPELHIR